MKRAPVLIGLVLVVLLVALTGTIVRSSEAGPVLRTVPVGSTPDAIAVAEQAGRVFVANQTDGTVTILDAQSGRMLRTQVVGPTPWTLLADERVGRVFVTDLNASVSTLDLHSGALLNTVDVVGAAAAVSHYQSIGSVAVDARSRHAFVTSYDGFSLQGHVTVLDTRTGAIVGIVAVGKVAGALAVDERTERVFALNVERVDARGVPVGPGSVSVLDARSGRVLRTVRVGFWPSWAAVDAQTGRVFVVNNPTVNGGSVSVLDTRSGLVLNTVAAGQFPGVPFVDTRAGLVFVAGSHGVLVLDAVSGRVLRTIPVLTDVSGIAQMAALDEQRKRAIAVTGAGVSIVDTRSGVLIRGLVAPGATVALDRRSGRLFVAVAGPRYNAGNPMDSGTVTVLDERNGAVLYSVTVGLLPTMLAVDERTERAFVVNAGCPTPRLPCGGRHAPDAWSWVPSLLRSWLPWLSPARSAPPTTGTVTVLDAAH